MWYSNGVTAIVAVVIVTLLGMYLAGCGSGSSDNGGVLKLGQSDNGKTYTVKTGDTIEIVLAGNPTTGYSWAAGMSDIDAALLQQVGEPAYIQEETDNAVVGAGGTYTFTFKAADKGEALLKLNYARSWESVEPLQTFAVTITIE